MRGAIAVTWHYIAGELSQLLGELQEVASDEMVALEISNLRREVEVVPFSALVHIAAESLALADDMCRISLARGDSVSFTRQLFICSELWCFGVSAGLFRDD
jgi:hypothetical protein